MKNLTDLGIVEHIGRGKYILLRELYSDTRVPDVHLQENSIDRETAKRRIVEHIDRNGDNGTPFGELYQVLPGYSQNQIRVLLRNLYKEKIIHPEGKTSAVKWFIGAEEA